MAIRKIETIPSEVLKRKARPVSDFGSDFQTLVDDMVETMRDAPGTGLAGPQVNVGQRIIVVEFGDEEDETIPPKLYIVANPEISKKSKQTELGTEGCLSIPEYIAEVERSTEITIKGQNRHGQKMKLKANGWLARIFQHEIDHLNGVLILDIAERIFKLEDLQQSQVEE